MFDYSVYKNDGSYINQILESLFFANPIRFANSHCFTLFQITGNYSWAMIKKPILLPSTIWPSFFDSYSMTVNLIPHRNFSL